MRLRLTAAFAEERRRYALQFTCEQCVHFDPPASRCAHEYPVEDHLEGGPALAAGELVFCKEFELR